MMRWSSGRSRSSCRVRAAALPCDPSRCCQKTPQVYGDGVEVKGRLAASLDHWHGRPVPPSNVKTIQT